MEGVNKKLSLLGGDSVDIFKGIPFATAQTLENPQRHPGWQGEHRIAGWPWVGGERSCPSCNPSYLLQGP